MAAISGDEFLIDAIENSTPDASIESWAISAATCVMMIAAYPEAFEKDDIVEAIQNLGRRLPVTLVATSAMNLKHIQKRFDG